MSWRGSLVFGKALLPKRRSRVAALGAVGLGACAVLAACSPVQAGAAAIVGDQRITVSSLDTQVSNLQVAAKPYTSSMQVTPAEYPAAVLSWLIRFSVMNEAAATNGITVTQTQSEQAFNSLGSVASTAGVSSTSELLIVNGIPPQLFPQLGQYEAQQTAYALKVNGGKEPTTTAAQTATTAAVDKAQCTASKSLSIRVSPQFGRLDYTQLTVVPAADTLSQPAVLPSPASTAGLTPAC
jgi:hypothetical protein